MALILDHFYSAALTECNSLTAIVPVENNEKSSYPVLWLLPPAGCDHTAWQRHTAVEDLAKLDPLFVWSLDDKEVHTSFPEIKSFNAIAQHQMLLV